MTKERIRTHAVWLTMYAALFSAVAFAGTPAIPEPGRAAVSPVVLNAQAPAIGIRPIGTRVDI